ncbi:mitochondrial sodium/calcium exchanger protein isoform X2 [Drosophila willistoni]|uniref:mitochondrial sodium/calcium exchanger protein isoform X2 n=1 Tax=Drosophila willistoni TaxID=7260 RepID=UPI001F074F00|nr:mitochondrial sodium/calcium exchanger protein isoform X2 [Drosophila willistoni]
MPIKNEILQAFEDHKEYLSCSNVKIVPYGMRCKYVTSTKTCVNMGNLINYLIFIECGLGVQNSTQELLAIIALSLLCVVYLLIVAIVADKYFSPALKSIAKSLRMNEHTTGVTLLAFGNTISDLSSNLSSNSQSLIFTSSLASALFAMLVTGGLICYLYPSQLAKYSTLRDILFFIFGIMLVEYLFATETEVSVWTSIGILSIYFVYLGITIADGYLQRDDDNKTLVILNTKSHFTRLSQRSSSNTKSLNNKSKSNVRLLPRRSLMATTSRMTQTSVNETATRTADYKVDNPKNLNLVDDFFLAIQPIDEEVWVNSNGPLRIFLILVSPLVLICQLLIPVFNVEHARHGWSKLLNCIHIVIAPLFPTMALFIKYTPWQALMVLITVPLALLAFFRSRTDVPPRFHVIYLFVGGFGSMFMIYHCTIEMTEAMKVVGMFLGLSEGFIAATISCWGTSLSTLVTNLTLAAHGYSAMAFAACYGGPFFSFIISTGLSMTLHSMQLREENMEKTSFGANAYVFLIGTLTSTLIWSLSYDFYGRRSIEQSTISSQF